MKVTSANNKRIAKNTILLYIRMLLMLAISLYTSRIILRVLGIEDYGINNVVGGVITMLGFFTSSLGGASSRFITFELGRGDMKTLKNTFGNILCIHLVLAGIVLVIGETIGLWFMTTQIQIPAERETAAFWVYQFSIFSSMLAVSCVPYNATIIAHEKMSAFAYISLVDALLKLLIVFLLMIVPFDKLITYAFLFLGIQLNDRLIYGIYCIRHFEETRIKPKIDKNQFNEILCYAGWTMNGNLAVMGYTQGLNILLNIFFGPVVNAARGIAVQVQNICQQFCTNFQMAVNPQITKCYAQREFDNMHKLIKRSSKFSFYILFFIILPLSLEAEVVLQLWLGNVPEYTISFLRLILVIGLFYTLINPILTSVHATGKLKRFQLIEGSMLLSIVPIAYILLNFFNAQPEIVFVVHLVVEFFTQIVRLKIVLPMIQMSIMSYVNEVIKPILKVVICSIPIPFISYIYMDKGFFSFFIICAICVIMTMSVIYVIGCTDKEKKFIREKVGIAIDRIKGL